MGGIWEGGKNRSAKNILLKSWNERWGEVPKWERGEVSRIKYLLLLLLLFIYISYSNIKNLPKKKKRKKNSYYKKNIIIYFVVIYICMF